MNREKLILMTRLLLIFLICLTGCGANKAEKVHREIAIGMSISEVIDILSKYEGRHQYRIKLCNKENICEEKTYNLADFVATMNEVLNKKHDYSHYEAKIIVLFVGPGYLKNDFEVIFNADNKVKTTTDVRHWD